MAEEGALAQSPDGIAFSLPNIGDILDRVRDAIKDAIGGLYNRLRDFVGDVLAGITNALGSVLNRMVEVSGAIISHVTDSLQRFIVELPDIIMRVGDVVSRLIRDSFTKLGDALENILQTLKPLIDRLAHFIQEVLPDIIGNIARYIGRLADSVITVAKSVASAITEGISSLAERIRPYLEPLVQAIQGIVSRLHDVLRAIVAFVADKIRPVWEYVDTNYIKPLRDWIKKVYDGVSDFGDAVSSQYVSVLLNDEDIPAGIRSLIPSGGILRTLVGFGMGAGILLMLAPTMLNNLYFGDMERLRQKSMARRRVGLISMQEAIDAYYKGAMPLGEVYAIASKQGIPDGHTAGLVAAYRKYPSAADMIYLVRLGVLGYDVYAGKMKEQGYRDDDARILFDATQYVPNVPDLIRMAVREVFTPEIAERFGQYEDFPIAFKEHAERIGLSESWAKAYWAAHWDLPSPQQGFEMFQRGVITRDELELLLRALDIMPFWREKLVQIAYAPYTRVDIRRMYQAGVLNRDEVKRAYKDIGYDDEKAEKLTRWTEEEYKAVAKEAKSKTRDLTMTTVINAYKKGILTRENARDYLMNLGYDEYETGILLDSADIDEYMRLRDKAIDRVKAAYKTGVIDSVGAREQLAKLGLKTDAIEDIIYEVTLDTRRAVRIPDKSDIIRMFKRRILSREETLEALEGLGYGRLWAERLVQIA